MSKSKSALIIANFRYEDPDLRQLVAPAEDAHSLARVLADPTIGGFEVRTLINEPSYKVCQEIEAFCENRKHDDLLVLYFSGHGVKDVDGQLYFATFDTRLVEHNLRRSSAVSAQFVNEAMSRSRSRRQILLLDCCYSGAFKRDMMAKAGKQAGAAEQFEGQGRIVLTASDALQYSFEGESIEGEGVRSIFTRTLVRGLETGEADLDRDGLFSLDEVYNYVFDRVSDEQPGQKPTKMGYVEGRLFIGSNPRPLAAKLPPELEKGLEDKLYPWVRTGAVMGIKTLLDSNNRGMVLAAEKALAERAARDDSSAIRELAAGILAARASASMPASTPAPDPASSPAPVAGLTTPPQPSLPSPGIQPEKTQAERAASDDNGDIQKLPAGILAARASASMPDSIPAPDPASSPAPVAGLTTPPQPSPPSPGIQPEKTRAEQAARDDHSPFLKEVAARLGILAETKTTIPQVPPLAAVLPEQLQQSLKDSRPEVRISALMELERLASKNPEFEFAVGQALAARVAGESSEEVRKLAAFLLASRGPASVPTSIPAPNPASRSAPIAEPPAPAQSSLGLLGIWTETKTTTPQVQPLAAALPEQLQESLKDCRRNVREGAVRELETLLASKNRGMILAAEKALAKRVHEDDSLDIRKLAAGILAARASASMPASTPAPEPPSRPASRVELATPPQTPRLPRNIQPTTKTSTPPVRPLEAAKKTHLPERIDFDFDTSTPQKLPKELEEKLATFLSRAPASIRTSERELRTLRGHTERVNFVAWNRAGELLATSADDRLAKIWKADTGVLVSTLQFEDESIFGISWGCKPRAHFLATGTRNDTLVVWNAHSGKEELSLKGHGSEVAWRPTGPWLASNCDGGSIQVRNFVTGECLPIEDRVWVPEMAWSTDGQFLAAGDGYGTTKIWHVETGRLKHTFAGNQTMVTGVSWHPDGIRLATAGMDGTLRVWDTIRGKQVLNLNLDSGPAENPVWGVSWSPNGLWMATGSKDGTVRILDASSGEEILRLHHASAVQSVAWSPDSRRLASGSEDQTAKIWAIDE